MYTIQLVFITHFAVKCLYSVKLSVYTCSIVECVVCIYNIFKHMGQHMIHSYLSYRQPSSHLQSIDVHVDEGGDKRQTSNPAWYVSIDV